jgi:hypothetical protein
MVVDALYSLLNAVEAHTYPSVTDQEVVPPFITHVITKTIPHPSKSGASTKDLFIVVVACYDDTQREAETLAESVRDTIDEYSGLVASTYIDKIRFMNQENGYDGEAKLFFTMQTYSIWVNYAT